MRDVKSLTFSALNSSARAIWSKSAPEHGVGHNLLAHLLDVAAVVETLLECEPRSTLDWAARRLGLPHDGCRRWIAALAGLHDFGKATPGFAAKWPAGREAIERAGLAFPESACRATNHSLATDALLGRPLHGLTGADAAWIRAIVQAISAHHGRHYSAAEKSHGTPTAEPPA